ncbi:hypothetical protein ABIE85_003908 [Bradyrhizobium diazoefficiens]|uniref:hypothetical protein n=1 Tax=Bradyrhizobium diazoefficiens TaxID=1355477 RepID=UPI002714FE51|nr:hypothetical protein [Bradyrhizobium diazoefficiens]WLA54607.1 hypothetical protein QIH81_29240 [Bradyrhizobium diazoefficiens]
MRRASGGLGVDTQLARMQLNHSLPFVIAGGIFALRGQAGQWGAAANFPSSSFALISIASAVMAIGTLTGQPLGNALLPNVVTSRAREPVAAQELYETIWA